MSYFGISVGSSLGSLVGAPGSVMFYISEISFVVYSSRGGSGVSLFPSLGASVSAAA